MTSRKLNVWLKVVTLAGILAALGACGETTSDTGDPVIVDAPEINSFVANPATIEAGQESTLSWSTAGEVSSVEIDNDVGEVSGSSVSVSPDETTTYTLTATGEGGTTTATTEVTVASEGNPDPPEQPEPPAGAPVVDSLSANPADISEGESSELTWSLSGGDVTTLTLTNDIDDDEQDLTGQTSVTVSPEETTVYSLLATNDAGSSDATTTVTVSTEENPEPPEDPEPPAGPTLEANNDTVEEEGPAIEPDVLDNDVYPSDGYTFPELTVSSQPPSGQGRVVVDDGALLYISDAYVGTTSFEYTLTIADEATGEEFSDSATVELTVLE